MHHVHPFFVISALLAACALAPLAVASDRVASDKTPASAPKPELVDVRRIWDKAPHNAFTDLIRYEDQWVCAFREAPAHKGGVKDSQMRVIVSRDAKDWQSAAVLADPRGDVRDAKLAILPDGRLMLLTAIQLFDRSKGQTHQSIAFYTRDLDTWEGPVNVGHPNFWMWGIEFHKDTGYTLGYSTTNDRFVRLYKTTDGVKYEPLVDRLDVSVKFPNESAIHFDADDTAHVLLRCDPDPAFLGTATPPYVDWTWTQSDTRIGGPALTRTPDGRLLAGGRLYDGKERTSLFWIDEQSAEFTECLTLPSGGDTSYPGFVWHDGVLHVSYYASHEEKKSRIYLARVKFPTGGAAKSR